MLVNSLIIGLITYTAAVIYNLIIRQSLELVFFLGLKFLVYSTLMTFFLQLSYYLIKDYNSGAATEIENSEDENGQLNSESELNDQGETATDSEAGQEFAESAVENEFDNQEFSAFNPEEFDYQQDNN